MPQLPLPLPLFPLRIILLPTILLALAFGPQPVSGTCKCAEVCSTYKTWQSECWKFGEFESACITEYNNNGPVFTIKCAGGCYCNLFGCNCDPCPYCPERSSSRRELALEAALETEPDNEAEEQQEEQQQQQQQDNGPCADYNEWTFGMTQKERVRRLAEQYCVDDDGDDNLDVYEAMPNIVQLAESLVDLRVGDQDGSMSCEEFNEAYLEIVPTDLCLHVNSTPHCELDGTCSNTTEAQETTTSGANGPDTFMFSRCFGSFALQASFLPLTVVPLLLI